MWTVAKPLEKAGSDRELHAFAREVFTRLKGGTFVWDPPNVPAGVTVDTTISATDTDCEQLEGLRAGMAITVTPPSTLESGVVVGACWVAADDTLTIRLANATAAGINPASGTWAFAGTVI